MAVKIMWTVDQIVQLGGFSTSAITQALDKGLEVTHSLSGRVWVDYPGMDTVQEEWGTEYLTQFLLGKLTGAYTDHPKVKSIREAVLLAVAMGIEQPEAEPVVLDDPKEKANPGAAVGFPLTTENATQHVAPPPAPPVAPPPAPTGSKTTLGLASALYQQVGGTDSSSVYLVVALGDDINVAARYKGNKLSIRLEASYGKSLSEGVKGVLKSSGFDVKSDIHGSVHVQSVNPKLAKRTLGALMMDLADNTNFITVLPDFSKLVGAGS